MTPPPLTPNNALFLDIDGTLIDLAATPDAVTIPPGLPEHGALLRDAAHNITHTAIRPVEYANWLKILNRYAAAMPGLLVEEKQFSLVIHYRRAPEHEAELRQLAEQLVAGSSDATLLFAHCAFELKPRNGNKGDALAHFMTTQPFINRTPIFIGDDTTDEPAITAANVIGGTGLHVARDFGGKTAAVREWLARLD